MQSDKEQLKEDADQFGKGLGFFNYMGRIVEKVKDGFVIGGCKFSTIEELKKNMDIALKDFGKDIH